MSGESAFAKQLDEVYLLQCSLLADESLSFVLPADEKEVWEVCLKNYSDGLNSEESQQRQPLASPCRFEVHIVGASLWFEVELPRDYPNNASPLVYVRGNIDRKEQEKWQNIIRDNMAELDESE